MANTDDHTARERYARAVQLAQAGERENAITLFEDLVGSDAPQVQVLSALIRLNLDERKFVTAADHMMVLASKVPGPAQLLADAADIYGRAEVYDKADAAYEALHKALPGYATGYFNHGFMLRSAHRFEDALAVYDRALALGIDSPEEVWLNKAAILSDHLRRDSDAEQCLRKALTINPAYVSALLNYANLHEERSNRDAAVTLYRRAAEVDPGNTTALARLINLSGTADAEHSLLKNAAKLAEAQNTPPSEASNLHFALGRSYDARGEFETAFKHYAEGNHLASHHAPLYDRKRSEAFFAAICDTFSADWFAGLPPVSMESPVFICGMFRSGSTLTEQIIAAHPNAMPGGELEYFVSLAARDVAPFPSGIQRKTMADFQNMAQDYLKLLHERFGDHALITDKRPDNFLYLGLIKSLFPKARFIHTTRHALDNCLSVYFLQLADSMAYARDLLDTGHYYVQQQKLMDHWNTLFPGDIFEMNYDSFIENPRQRATALLEFLGLPWHEDCLEFHKLRNTVKTESYWQVREPLYTRSVGRHRNYKNHLAPLQQYLEQHSLI
ncbi:sulfotransferase [Kordiimonas sp.]|uniref:tetratricopeptide repeat-containing sulfotransferase family protein n=1 Tax=Kordiimonas sp. TaxID=1970157 RepID=UPI003A8E775E